MGVAGAAISTLVSRIFCAVVVIWELRNEKNPISIRNYLAIRPDFSSIKKSCVSESPPVLRTVCSSSVN